MALHQAEQVTIALEAHDPAVSTKLVKVTTAGDRWMGDLAKLAIRAPSSRRSTALPDDQADLAVHCFKDIPGDVPIPLQETRLTCKPPLAYSLRWMLCSRPSATPPDARSWTS